MTRILDKLINIYENKKEIDSLKMRISIIINNLDQTFIRNMFNLSNLEFIKYILDIITNYGIKKERHFYDIVYSILASIYNKNFMKKCAIAFTNVHMTKLQSCTLCEKCAKSVQQ